MQRRGGRGEEQIEPLRHEGHEEKCRDGQKEGELLAFSSIALRLRAFA